VVSVPTDRSHLEQRIKNLQGGPTPDAAIKVITVH